MSDLLSIRNLVVEYPVGGGRHVHAVSDVTLSVKQGETLGLVGESGSGKSSLARALLQLPPAKAGAVVFDGKDLTQLRGQALRAMRPRLQMIFQDPIASLNPRRRVAEIIAEPLIVSGVSDAAERTRRVRAVMEAVGLDPDLVWNRRPHEFSGGQCQRIAIARALVLEPGLIVCDEPVSALDVSIRAQIVNLLEDMKARFGLTLLFIAHDLAVVKSVSDRVAVMYLGRLCEVADSDSLFATPAHPYTAALMAAIPVPDPDVPLGDTKLKPGDPPSPLDPPSGCRFRTRCPHAQPRCTEEVPPLRQIAPGREVACHFPLVG
ncbi:oligopeptide/dipeptide ABC transporter ATP-binding protein [Reyranella sp.]|jgi:peptide/nickel transport system ATP-binding protein|uniref:ABC transporter ATP-binding protein n=1 Tax=Reyranella sp. TaxID=1929291 RepID=UPI000BC8A977|nr:oligopeptide/dipeptide ABC transporter ATP-binding protein [Reyranella sp.]OYY40283.1 MAG: peptide ABC transporter ATP-binding protein [Rhodospirillales bacterium 35-66-84]OYZ92835.1 MAG: peptide ABC transporter ATP-binding protein [Rhodospirillales bacterium 24-66-33]OZB22556.1 MAG: peptide ABC transporter ATP-binding protein [Rhodospirillales bacterium 39-66-50]HQS18922.1 ATP-binding cassette domain-containing protein [Reyranella sp.]HQT12309.1 ATP-binding cassette domain-containing prote